MASFRGAHKSCVQNPFLEVTWDVRGAVLLLAAPCAGNYREAEPGRISDLPKCLVMSCGLWAWLGEVL